MLDRRAHEPVDQFFQNYLARDCLRDLDHRGQIQEFAPCHDRARCAASRVLFREVGIELVELPYFAVSPPTEIAITGLPQIHLRDLFEASCPVEPGSNFVGNRLIVDESIGVRRVDGLFVKAFGVDHAALYSCDFGSHECGTVFKILRAMLRPYFELSVVCSQSLEMFVPLTGSSAIPCCRMRKRTIESECCLCKQCWVSPKQLLRL